MSKSFLRKILTVIICLGMLLSVAPINPSTDVYAEGLEVLVESDCSSIAAIAAAGMVQADSTGWYANDHSKSADVPEGNIRLHQGIETVINSNAWTTVRIGNAPYSFGNSQWTAEINMRIYDLPNYGANIQEDTKNGFSLFVSTDIGIYRVIFPKDGYVKVLRRPTAEETAQGDLMDHVYISDKYFELDNFAMHKWSLYGDGQGNLKIARDDELFGSFKNVNCVKENMSDGADDLMKGIGFRCYISQNVKNYYVNGSNDVTIDSFKLTKNLMPEWAALKPEVTAAINAITALPAVADIALTDQTAVEAARALVVAAKAIGAIDADITNLQTLVDCEAKIITLEKAPAITAAIDAIAALPAVADIALTDKTAVEAARALVDAAKAKGAVDADITNLQTLAACETKIKELEAVLISEDCSSLAAISAAGMVQADSTGWYANDHSKSPDVAEGNIRLHLGETAISSGSARSTVRVGNEPYAVGDNPWTAEFNVSIYDLPNYGADVVTKDTMAGLSLFVNTDKGIYRVIIPKYGNIRILRKPANEAENNLKDLVYEVARPFYLEDYPTMHKWSLYGDGQGNMKIAIDDVLIGSFKGVNCVKENISDGDDDLMKGIGFRGYLKNITGEDRYINGSIDVTIDSFKLTRNLTPEWTVQCTKTRSTYFTAQKVAAARQNVLTYDWAQNIKYNAVQKADKFLGDYTDEQVWNLVIPQSIGRTCLVDYPKYTCPVCGGTVTYGWLADPVNDPWKLKCPLCDARFPSNDFGAYYKSGLDENGIFNPSLADRSLLKNTLYSDKGDSWGVDDGTGWVDETGSKHLFIAFYDHWKLWYSGEIENALNNLSNAYLYTGDTKYSHAGIILLDRVADVYPSMDLKDYTESDGYINSEGGTGKGKIIGSIWETGLAKSFISAYDAFFPAMATADSANVVEFLSGKASQYHLGNTKSTVAHIKKNIEDGILRQIFPAVKDAKIRGNSGMHESTLAMAAVVLDEPSSAKEWIDWIYQTGTLVSSPDWHLTGGNIMNTLVNDVDRDGFGNEAAPHYNNLWLDQFKVVADVLDGYDGYPEGDLYNNVKFRKMFYTSYPLRMIERYLPTIGDTAASGNEGVKAKLDYVITAFEKFRDPVFAQLAYFLNGNKVEGLHGSVFNSDPYKIASDIQTVIDQNGVIDHLDSTNLTGYGFTALRDGENYNKEYGVNYKFIQMTPVEATQGTVPDTRDDSVQFEAKAVGDNIIYSFQVPKDGQYEVKLKGFKCGSYGKYDISIDGNKVCDYNFYSDQSMYTQLDPIATIQLTAGTHQVKFIATGKEDASTNYKMCIIQMYLITLQDKEESRINSAIGDRQRDLWMYYGINSGHGHSDTLNLGMHAYGLDLAPDLGYPEQTGANPPRIEWVSNTASHNTVVVDKSRQKQIIAGTPLHYEDSSIVKLVDVEAPDVYPQTQLYRRTTAMVKVDDENSYTVDIFRVKGGNDHYYSFHAAEGDVATTGLKLVEQPTGTYAGPDVAYGECTDDDDQNAWIYNGSGFHYLKNVKRDEKPKSGYSVDWDIVDTWKVLKNPEDVHVRLTMLNDVNDAAISDGYVPQIQGNPKTLKYLMAHRSGINLESQFVSVIEPYKNQSNIKLIESVSMIAEDGKSTSASDAYAVKVTLNNGRKDYVINSINPDIQYCVDDKLLFKGSFGVYSEVEGKVKYTFLSDGTYLGKKSKPQINGTYGRLTGKVESFTQEMSVDNEISIRLDANYEDKLNDLTGKYIYVENDGKQNAVYQIKQIKKVEGNLVTLGIGDITLIRSWADNSDFSKGFIYDIQKDANASIPLSILNVSVSNYLESIKIGEHKIPEFARDKYEYTIVLPYGSTQVPPTIAVPEDITAQVDVMDAGSLDKATTIVVTALDGSSRTYRIYFH